MKNSLKLTIILLMQFLFLNAFAAANSDWGYVGKIGPENWGRLNNQYTVCSTGKQQSPIDIPKQASPSKYALNLKFQNSKFDIVEDGATNLDINGHATITYTGHGLQINFKHQATEEISFSGNDYKLIQFHFHTPGENRLAGQAYPAEIHFVHQSKNKKVAVIAVFIEKGQENPTLQKILDRAPKDIGIEHQITDTMINPYDLLPASKNYFNFVGSLTSPPCNEGLEWLVMSQPIAASEKQIQQLNTLMGNNSRPLQATNQRKIMYAVEK